LLRRTVTLLVGLLLQAHPALAFDSERPGLILGAGIGPATSFVNQDLDGFRFDSFTRFGAAMDLRAGWGVSEAIVLFASARSTWIRYDTRNRDNSDVLHGVIGLGMTQYFSSGRSDWYSTGHLGFSFFELVEESADTLTGFGFGAGIGRQWREYLGTEFLLGWETSGVTVGSRKFDTSIFTLRLVVVGTVY
jgi:hypothetical protein